MVGVHGDLLIVHSRTEPLILTVQSMLVLNRNENIPAKAAQGRIPCSGPSLTDGFRSGQSLILMDAVFFELSSALISGFPNPNVSKISSRTLSKPSLVDPTFFA